MNENDYDIFSEKWLIAHQKSSSNKIPHKNTIRLVFSDLIDFDLRDVLVATNKLARKSSYKPTVHGVIEILNERGIYCKKDDVKPPSVDKIIALARLANTPLGILAMIQIGSYDLQNRDGFYLKQRAEEVLVLFDSFVRKCISGDYSKHELLTMKKYGVNPLARLAKGLPVPKNGIKAGKEKMVNSRNYNNQQNISNNKAELALVKRK